MANNIALAQKYLNDPKNFNQVYKMASKTADLESNDMKFLDANTVKLPNYKFNIATMGNYSRDTGAPSADLVEIWNTYTLSQDKGNSLTLDVMDDEETLGEGMVKRANEFTRQVIVPSIDTYRFSVIAKAPTPGLTPADGDIGAHIHSVTTASVVGTIIGYIDTAFEYLEEKEVGTEGLILYVTPAIRNLMQRSTDIDKKFAVQRGGADVDTRIETYNGAKIVVVPSARLGANVEFILVNPKSVASAVKFNESRLIDLDATSTNKFGTAWKYRVYYDIFHNLGGAIQEGTTPNFVKVNPGVFVKKSA